MDLMRRMTRWVAGTLALVGLLVGVGWKDVQAQGPFSAQIQMAIRALTNGTTTFSNLSIVVNGNTGSVDGAVFANNTVATAGTVVENSPRLRFRANVWNGAANQTSDAWWENGPINGVTTASLMRLGAQDNGGAVYYPVIFGGFPTSPAFEAVWFTSNAVNPSVGNYAFLGHNNSDLTALNAASGSVELRISNVTHLAMGNNGVTINGASNSVPTVPLIVNNAANSLNLLTITNAGLFSTNSTIQAGTAFITAGAGLTVANVGANSCGTTAATIAGNNNAFEITVGATSGTQCRVAFSVTAATAWDCTANDQTTAVIVRTAPVDTTHADFLASSFTAADKITAVCFAR